MFTGIVEELGEVIALERLDGDAARLTVRGPTVTADARFGDSIAVNGVCLTVTEVGEGSFGVDVMAETLTRSALGALGRGSAVNLERAVRVGDRLGGHIVQGHVDGTGTISARTPAEHWETLSITLPPELLRYLVAKGSVTVDGVSLTVTDVGPATFGVSLIPTTLALTTLGRKQVGDPVNLEVDVIAKYVERLVASPAPAGEA